MIDPLKLNMNDATEPRFFYLNVLYQEQTFGKIAFEFFNFFKGEIN